MSHDRLSLAFNLFQVKAELAWMQWREGAQRLVEDSLLLVKDALIADEAEIGKAAAKLAVAKEEMSCSSAAAVAAAELRSQLLGLEEAEAEQEYLLSAVLRPSLQELVSRETALNDQIAARASAPPACAPDEEDETVLDASAVSEAQVFHNPVHGYIAVWYKVYNAYDGHVIQCDGGRFRR